MTSTDGPHGREAELSPLTGGRGINLVTVRPLDLAAAGYEEAEHAASGTATSYRAVNELPADGTFELERDLTAEYTTRVVVRRPANAKDFNGTVVVEWLNVSGGLDANPNWMFAEAEILRGGYAWVGVSAQQIGVQGGQAVLDIAAAPKGGVKAADPERYASLAHPGDAFAYDIYTQVARAVREPGLLGELVPERVLAVGESQSAFMLTTYINGAQPLTRAFDGFLVHSRGGTAAPLGTAGEPIQLAQAIFGEPCRIRTDGRAPVLVLEMEGDLLAPLGFHKARQPDAERFRLWEVAGSAHADAFLLGPMATGLFDGNLAVNDGPQRFLVRSALRHLHAWVRDGVTPPEAPRLDVDELSDPPVFVRDADGNVRGGIRTPLLDVPVAVLSGEPGDLSNMLAILFGQTVPFSAERLRELYPTTEDYREAYEGAADEAIKAGWVLAEDRDELLGMAASSVG